MRRFPALAASLFAFSALGSCVSAPAPAPAPEPRPVPVPSHTPRPRPAAVPVPPAADWRDWPVTAGTWAYRRDERGSIALFGRAGEDADFTLRCDRQRAQIYLSRHGDPAVAGPLVLTLRTTSQSRTLTALSTGGGQGYFAVQFGVRDPLLDAIGFSRGRFVVEGGGLPPLVMPPWAEILRVIEDCR